MSEHKAYRQIFNAISIFGGVQVLVIIFGIVRNKVAALTMGPSGVGTIGLFTTAVTLMIAISSFGIGSSGVKVISENYHQNNSKAFSENLSVFNRLSWVFGILGAILTIILSPFLSKITFGNYDHTIDFGCLSIAVMFIALDTKNMVLLQSVMNLKNQGKASVFGALMGTVLVVPLYIAYGEKSIVASIIILFFANLVFSYMYTKKVTVTDDISISYSDFKAKSRQFISLGFAMTISYIMVMAVSYLVRLYISQKGGIQEVGLYQAGWAIVNGYVGLIFTAMAKDYFPRLSSVNADNIQICKMANQQMELGLLILSPIIIGFLVFMNHIISILYSQEFYSIKNMMIWSLLGMFFKLLSWSISYIFLAKGFSKQFITYEIVINIVTIFFNVLFYKYLGLEGLGFSFFVVNLLYLAIVFIMARYSFKFSFTKPLLVLFAVNIFICTLLAVLLRLSENIHTIFVIASFIVGSIIVVLVSILGLNKRMGFF